MSDDERMPRPGDIPLERWEQHLDWMQVTGSTLDEHLREHRSGELWKQFQRRSMTRRRSDDDAGSPDS